MKHLQLSLVDAYLIVRSRRLSVLIQPNMRLLYNLCGWEVELARRRARSNHNTGSSNKIKKDSDKDNTDKDSDKDKGKDKDKDINSKDDEEDEVALRRVLKKCLNWPYLAREVHLLNEKYLH
jgi:dual specificity MAP kinase phosphatase